MNQLDRLNRTLVKLYGDTKTISLRDFVKALKLTGLTLDDTLEFIKEKAIRENVPSGDIPSIEHQATLSYYKAPETNSRSIVFGENRHTKQEWDLKKHQYNYKCFYCREKIKLTKDHLIPFSRGGKDDIENIVPACLPCNRRKRDMRVEVFKEGVMLKLL